MKQSVTRAQGFYAGIKSVLLTVCLGLAMSACQKSPNDPMPPQAPPTPKAASNAPNAGNPYPGLYDASSVSGAVFQYESLDELQYQNAQGKTVKRLVIRT